MVMVMVMVGVRISISISISNPLYYPWSEAILPLESHLKVSDLHVITVKAWPSVLIEPRGKDTQREAETS